MQPRRLPYLTPAHTRRAPKWPRLETGTIRAKPNLTEPNRTYPRHHSSRQRITWWHLNCGGLGKPNPKLIFFRRHEVSSPFPMSFQDAGETRRHLVTHHSI